MLEERIKELEFTVRLLESKLNAQINDSKENEKLLDMAIEIIQENENVYGIVERIERWLVNHHSMQGSCNEGIVYGYETAQKDVKHMIDSWRKINSYAEKRSSQYQQCSSLKQRV
jgi:hypothetical protein